MRGFKAFLGSFFFSFTVMCRGLGAVYAGRRLAERPVTGGAEKVPVAKPGVNDSKTLLIGVGDTPFFFLVKLNAIENRVAIAGISPGWENLGGVCSAAGGSRAAQAASAALGVKIDYYLICGGEQAREILRDFGEIEVESAPAAIGQYLLKNARRADGDSLINRREAAGGFLDNRVGIEFLTLCRERFVRGNWDSFAQKLAAAVKEGYNSLDTNLNTADLEGLERIGGFLAKVEPQIFTGRIAAQDGEAKEKISRLFGVENRDSGQENEPGEGKVSENPENFADKDTKEGNSRVKGGNSENIGNTKNNENGEIDGGKE